MKAVTAEIMQELDRLTINRFGIPGLELMENAGRNCAGIIQERYGTEPGCSVVIFAGKGNNGGDGYVIARLLCNSGWQVTVILSAGREAVLGDAKSNLELLPNGISLLKLDGIAPAKMQQLLSGATLLVDALFGTGLKSEVTGIYAEAIAMINGSGRPVLAVDIPSGVDATSGRILGTAVRADITVTFAVAKLGHLLYPGAEHAGELLVTDIGIPAELAESFPSVEFFDASAATALLRSRKPVAHKGDNGHSLIIAGSIGKSGAAALAANSAMRSGAGLVTLAVPAAIHSILEIKTTEAMTVPLADNGGALSLAAFMAIARLLPDRDVVAIGPGLGLEEETVSLVRQVVAAVRIPLVMDADALNAIAGHLDILGDSPSPAVVLTPHPGEMARLTGMTVAEVESDRLAVAKKFAGENNVHLILKGARTIVAAPDGRCSVNASGNPGMATGGMGDVLTGVVTALLSQGYDPFAACRLAVFCHGLAGDMVAEDKGEIGLLAGDVQEMLPYVFKKIAKRR